MLNSDNLFLKENLEDILKFISTKTKTISWISELTTLPNISADYFILINIQENLYNQHNTYFDILHKHNLTLNNSPFSELFYFSLNSILKAIQYGVEDWFDQCIESNNKENSEYRCIIDTKNKIISTNDFPINKSYAESVSMVKKKYITLNKILQKKFTQSNKICFICSSNLDVQTDFKEFLLNLNRLYSNKKFTLLNMRYNSTQHIIEHKIGKNITIYDINVNSLSTEKIEYHWNKICKNLILSDKFHNNKKEV